MIEQDYNELITGKGCFPVQFPNYMLTRLALTCWITAVAELLVTEGGYFKVNAEIVVKSQRYSEHDKVHKREVGGVPKVQNTYEDCHTG